MRRYVFSPHKGEGWSAPCDRGPVIRIPCSLSSSLGWVHINPLCSGYKHGGGGRSKTSVPSAVVSPGWSWVRELETVMSVFLCDHRMLMLKARVQLLGPLKQGLGWAGQDWVRLSWAELGWAGLSWL